MEIYSIGYDWEQVKSKELFDCYLALPRVVYPSSKFLISLFKSMLNGTVPIAHNRYYPFMTKEFVIYRPDFNINLQIWFEDVKSHEVTKGFKQSSIICLFLYEHITSDLSLSHIFEEHLDSISRNGFPFPFVAIHYTKNDDLTEFKLSNVLCKKYKMAPLSQNEDIIYKSIEFPPEYHSAGLGILNYFGTYLREQYPDENATVRIEQEGLIVRLIVSSKDGQSSVIEKALQEYQMIVAGGEVPQSVANNNRLSIELKNELRMATVRIETQKDIMAYQQSDIKELQSLLKLALSQRHTTVISANSIASATANNESNVTVNISQVLQEIAHLKSELPSHAEAHTELEDVERAVETLKDETDPKVVKHSSAMSKLGDFLNKAIDGTDKTISTGEKAWKALKKLAGTYNSIAQWCGLPQVPTIFTK